MCWRAMLLCLCFALGCSAHPLRTTPPFAPPEEGTTWLEGAGGVRLYFSTHSPAQPVRAVVFFVLGPEIGAAPLYPKLTAALDAAGVATAVIHPRGAGFSDGMRGDIDDYARFLDDLSLGLKRARQRFPAAPVFVFGHSAGGALALEVAATQREALAGVVLVNPAYKLVYGEGMGPSFGDYVAFAWNSVFRRSALTVDMNSNPSAVRYLPDREEGVAMQKDPLVVRYFSMRYMVAQRDVMNACASNVAKLQSPLLLIQGAHDALVDPRGNDEILASARMPDKRKLIAPEGGHGATAVETLVDELVQWLRAHAP